MSWREGLTVELPANGFGPAVICRMTGCSLGAKVNFGLPHWRRECLAGEMLEGNHTNPAAGETAVAGRTAGARPRILVVEDESLVALDIAHILSEAGFDVLGPAGRTATALQLLQRSGCDAAVLDINLGNETSEAVALELIGRGKPFVTVSGYSKDQHPQVFQSAPALAKPIRPDLLIAELRRCIAQGG